MLVSASRAHSCMIASHCTMASINQSVLLTTMRILRDSCLNFGSFVIKATLCVLASHATEASAPDQRQSLLRASDNHNCGFLQPHRLSEDTNRQEVLQVVNNHKVRLLMEALREGKPLAAAAAKAGMSENTARKWRDSEILPGEVRQERLWRSREDPFREV